MADDLARPIIEFPFCGSHHLPGDPHQAGLFWEVIAKQSVHVFDCSFFPGFVWATEVGPGIQRSSDAAVTAELGAVVEGQCFDVEALENLDQPALDSVGMLAFEMTDTYEAGLAFHCNQQAARVMGTFDQIDLPMAVFLALIGFARSLADRHSTLDRPEVGLATIAPATSLVAGA